MAWLHVRRHGQDEALRRAEAGLRKLASPAGRAHPAAPDRQPLPAGVC